MFKIGNLNLKGNIIIKIACIITLLIVVSLIVVILTRKHIKKDELEAFTNKIEEEKNEYFKYTETILDNKDQNINKLYENYSGEGKGLTEWKHLNLHQCIDRCNKIDNCIGFSRDLVNDDEKASCYPRNILSTCHSSRKGNFEQRQEAINYNTYIKRNIEEQRTRCIGDDDMTLNRLILLKPYAYPNKYLGLLNNKVQCVTKKNNEMMALLFCKFKIEIGKEGSGTVSLRHVETGKYLYRDINDVLICKKIDMSSTNEKQRASFYLNDGLSNQIVLRCMILKGEKMTRYVSVDKRGKYLNIISSVELNKNDNKYLELLTFDIVDFISNNTIISNNNDINIKSNKQHNKQNQIHNKIHKDGFSDIEEDRLEMYQYLESGLKEEDYKKEKEENVNDINQINIGKYKSLSDIDMAFDKILDGDKTIDYGKAVYQNTINFNNHLYDGENGISNKNKEINNQISKNLLNLDKMRIQDMSRDYYYLKNLVDEQEISL